MVVITKPLSAIGNDWKFNLNSNWNAVKHVCTIQTSLITPKSIKTRESFRMLSHRLDCWPIPALFAVNCHNSFCTLIAINIQMINDSAWKSVKARARKVHRSLCACFCSGLNCNKWSVIRISHKKIV